MLGTWLYVSLSTVSEEDPTRTLEEIARVSRERNEALGLTAALLFTGTRFCQRVEGPTSIIRDLQHKIAADKRHRDVVTLREDVVASRFFENQPLVVTRNGSRFVDQVIDRAIADAKGNRDGSNDNLTRILVEFSRGA